MSLKKEDFHVVGKIKEAHALKGESYVIVFSKSADWVTEAKTLGLGSSTESVTELRKFKLTRELKGGLILKFEGVPDRTAAEALINQYVFVHKDHLVAEKGDTIFLGEILGFTVYDQGQLIGVIEGFSSNGPQDLLIVGERKHLIPFVQDFILNLDFPNRKLEMKLPEGLLDHD